MWHAPCSRHCAGAGATPFSTAGGPAAPSPGAGQPADHASAAGVHICSAAAPPKHTSETQCCPAACSGRPTVLAGTLPLTRAGQACSEVLARADGTPHRFQNPLYGRTPPSADSDGQACQVGSYTPASAQQPAAGTRQQPAGGAPTLQDLIGAEGWLDHGMPATAGTAFPLVPHLLAAVLLSWSGRTLQCSRAGAAKYGTARAGTAQATVAPLSGVPQRRLPPEAQPPVPRQPWRARAGQRRSWTGGSCTGRQRGRLFSVSGARPAAAPHQRSCWAPGTCAWAPWLPPGCAPIPLAMLRRRSQDMCMRLHRVCTQAKCTKLAELAGKVSVSVPQVRLPWHTEQAARL